MKLNTKLKVIIKIIINNQASQIMDSNIAQYKKKVKKYIRSIFLDKNATYKWYINIKTNRNVVFHIKIHIIHIIKSIALINVKYFFRKSI